MNKQSLSLNVDSSQRIAFSIATALAAIVCLTSFYAIWQWRTDWQLAHRPPAQDRVVQAQDNFTAIIASIPEDHLFGQSLAKLGEMPLSDLQLQVTGIIKVENGEAKDASKVFISVSQQPSKIFKVGDPLPYGVKVYQITPEAVVIENNGRFEKLPLPRKPLQFKTHLKHAEESAND